MPQYLQHSVDSFWAVCYKNRYDMSKSMIEGEKRMIFFQDTKRLTNEVIDSWSENAVKAYQKIAGKRAESTVKLRLSIEELLLRFRDLYGTEEPCSIKGIRRLGGISFELSQRGTPQNPLETDPETSLSYNLLAKLNLNPHYAYRQNRSLNVVTIPAPLKKRKNAMLIGILVAAVLSVVTWRVSGLLPKAVLDDYMIPLVSGLFTKLSAVFSALATPLVFCAVITGINGIGDVSSFGKLGGRLLKRMMASYGISMLALLAIGLPMGLVSPTSSASGGNVFGDLLELVLDIIPGNLVEPFRIDNALQVIVIAVFVGVIMLGLSDKVDRLRTFIDEAGTLVNRLMMAVCKLLPLFVYLGFTNLLLSGKLSELGGVSKIVIICLGASAITVAVTTVRTLIVTKRSFKELFSAQLPALMINLTTSSQVSALPESMKCCKQKWGIDEKFVNFGMPLGIVIYMPCGAIMLGAIVWVLTYMSAGSVDPITLVKLVFVSVIVAIAAPPIPGSAFAVLPIMFSACGTDLSMMPLAVIIGSTVGYLMPALNGYCMQLELLMSAHKSGCIKKDHTAETDSETKAMEENRN